VKRVKKLGGKAPRRGGRLTRPHREKAAGPKDAANLMIVVVGGFLVLGMVAGFAWGMDRQLRGGILRQRVEAMQRPDWVPLESLPAHVPRAFLLAVDPGFEDGRTIRAREEGNTLTRELVRQVHLLGDGLAGEARELVMAPVLEQRASQRQLLELYLNRVYLGIARDHPVYGIRHAALEYLGKDPRQLTVGEAAALAGLLLEPRIERPDERSGAVGIRRNEVLRGLVAAGDITPEQFATALQERLPFQPGISEMPMSRRLPSPADTAVIRVPPEYLPVPEPEEEVP
jgi:membrane peptidoglycan carboxypeptidase